MGRAVLQYSHCTYDTAQGGAGRAGAGLGRASLACKARAGHARGTRGARAGHARGTQQARHGRWACGTGAGRAAWACCWPTGCALGALSLFLARFDPVLFLSQFLDIVRETGS